MAKTKTELDLRLFDDTIEQDAEYAVTDIQPFSDLDDLKIDFDAPTNYATLENNQWRLDGTMSLFPVDMTELKYGYWSQSQSDENRNINVGFVIDFTEPHSSIGITFIFYAGDYATDINIKWYDASDVLILDETYTNDRNICYIDEEVSNYQRIEIEFLKNNKAGHYIKIQEIGFGADILFTDEDIQTCSIVEELDSISEEISINKMDASVFIKDTEYINKIYKLLTEQQKIIAYEYVDEAKQEMGTFYLKSRSNPNENTIKFSTEDILSALSSQTYYGGMVNDTFENVISSIMSDFGTTLYEISDELKTLNVKGYLPVSDYRRAIQLLAFAVNAVVDCSRSKKIKFYKLSTTNPQSVDNSRYFLGSGQSELDRVTGVSLNIKSYTAESISEEIYNVEHTSGTYIAVFTDPFTNLSIQNGTIIESNENYAKFSTSGGTVIISGKPYKVSVQNFLIETDNLPVNVTKNVLEFENSILWDGEQNAQNLYNKSINLNERSVRILLNTEKVGDYVEVDALYNEKIKGYINSVTVDMTGGFIGQAKINGVIV